MLWDHEVPGSNPGAPTNQSNHLRKTGRDGSQRGARRGRLAPLVLTTTLLIVGGLTAPAGAQCPPTDGTVGGLQVGAYVDDQPYKGQRANVSFLARYELRQGRAATIVERRFCLWPDVAAEVEGVLARWLQAPTTAESETLWEKADRREWAPPWYGYVTMTIEGRPDRVRLIFYDVSTNGLPAGDDAMASGSLAVELSPAEVAALVQGLAEWRAAPTCRPLARFAQ